jgi:hypothetical protein
MFRGPSWIRSTGVVLLLLASFSAGTLALPHADDCDADCGPIAVAHDRHAHRVGADPVRTSAEADHCVLCHSLRSFYIAFETFEHHSGARAERLHVVAADRAHRVVWTLAPGRAPPS